MKILHLIKTSDGARWGAEMVGELVKMGVDITVVLPSGVGRMIERWEQTGAELIYEDIEFSISKAFQNISRLKKLKYIINKTNPNIIHSHFVSTTLMARFCAGSIPVVFQVPGPLHLENRFFRTLDILTARKIDKWIASSCYIKKIYLGSGIDSSRVGLSYYGNELEKYEFIQSNIRSLQKTIGNLSYFYPPKRFLFQTKGLKGHELMIDVVNNIDNVIGKFWGGSLSSTEDRYTKKLKSFASDKILFPGRLRPFEVSDAWRQMDVCLHLPLSENCGGVLEPLLHEVPVVAAKVGGLSEVVIPGVTGILVERNLEDATRGVKFALDNLQTMKKLAINGRKLISTMFDVKRTSREIKSYYEALDYSEVEVFDSKRFCENEL